MYLRDNKMKVVPFDIGPGFCLLSGEDNPRKMESILSLPQFESIFQQGTDLLVRAETAFNRPLPEIFRARKVTTQIYDGVRSTDAQQIGLYGSKKVRRAVMPLSPVVSFTGSTALQKLRTAF